MYSRPLGYAALLLLFWMSRSVTAQNELPLIDAANIEQLAPVSTIEFATLPAEAGTIINGRVYVSGDGRHLAVANRDSQVILLTDEGELLGVGEKIATADGFPATFIDGAFDPSGQRFGAIHSAGSLYYVTLYTLEQGHESLRVQSEDKPVGMWLDGTFIWLEVVPQDPSSPPYLARLAYASDGTLDTEPELLPLALADDREAVVRIGRLPAPFAVTATASGEVSRWDLSAGERTGTAQVSDVPIYGAMTPDGRYLVWRDPASRALHRLDFETGIDQARINLRGTYIPFIMVSLKADVILGVHVDDEAVVMGWAVGSGQSYRLGLYRQCARPPDMVVLSGDGTSLVIGCDAGLQVWRVVQR